MSDVYFHEIVKCAGHQIISKRVKSMKGLLLEVFLLGGFLTKLCLYISPSSKGLLMNNVMQLWEDEGLKINATVLKLL